jgi:hypothetical protein
MNAPKWAVAAGIAVLAGFLYIVLIALSKYTIGSGINPVVNAVLVFVALVVLIGVGNMAYGRNSHYAKAQARIRPAQQEHNRAADEANAARRAATQPAVDADEGAPPPS